MKRWSHSSLYEANFAKLEKDKNNDNAWRQKTRKKKKNIRTAHENWKYSELHSKTYVQISLKNQKKGPVLEKSKKRSYAQNFADLD